MGERPAGGGDKDSPEGVLPFSLLGGPLYRLARRVGLVRGTNMAPLALVLGPGTWIVLVALVLVKGAGSGLLSLSLIAMHVRFLVVIPLFFLCETLVDPRMATFVDTIVRSGVVPRDTIPALNAEIARTLRRKDSWIPEAVCLIAAVSLSVFATQLGFSGTTASYDPSLGAHSGTSEFYWVVCLPLFRFLGLRWIWRMALWSRFLWRVSRLDLRLVPTHPDEAGGLGYLEVVHSHFLPLILAISVIQAATLAEEVVSGASTFDSIAPAVAIILLADATLFIGPMLLFTSKLWACRVLGLGEYMDFAADYVGRFDRKWLRAPARLEDLLGTPDLQSLADLSNSVSIVRRMRVVTISVQFLRNMAAAAVAPLLPLLLLKYPVSELAQKFFARLSGL